MVPRVILALRLCVCAHAVQCIVFAVQKARDAKDQELQDLRSKIQPSKMMFNALHRVYMSRLQRAMSKWQAHHISTLHGQEKDLLELLEDASSKHEVRLLRRVCVCVCECLQRLLCGMSVLLQLLLPHLAALVCRNLWRRCTTWPTSWS